MLTRRFAPAVVAIVSLLAFQSLTRAGSPADDLAALKADAAGQSKLDENDARRMISELFHTIADHKAPPAVEQEVDRLVKEKGDALVPSPKHPITVPLDKLLHLVQVQQDMAAPPQQVKAYPNVADFPGDIPPGTRRITRTITVGPKDHAWVSTGLYAPPGQVITIESTPGAIDAKFSIRINCHKDELWNRDKWVRPFHLSMSQRLTTRMTRMASPFGGLIYIDVPHRDRPIPIQVRIIGAVAAPYFELGKTPISRWRAYIRNDPAPWAELATDKIILTVPSAVVRKLDDPTDLMKFWNQVMDADADLACIPHERDTPMRMVTDRQISAGYMHSGYPIMTPVSVAGDMVSLAHMKKGDWGMFHELGHNHQSGDWTFGGTGEVTVNLFTVYVFENVCHNEPSHNVGPDVLMQRYRKYVAEGRSFDKWKSDPFLALSMYIQLKDAFGWDTYKKVFAEYRGLSRAERPHNDDEKRDQWMVRFSRAAGKNLGPFFAAWGVPVSDKAKQAVANLPTWMPAGMSAP